MVSNAEAGNGGASRVTSDMSFTIRHSIGDITYDAEGFVAKNTDQLRAEFVDVINNSDDSSKYFSIILCPVCERYSRTTFHVNTRDIA